MKKTLSMQIVNEYVLDADIDLRVFEIKNDAEEHPTYDYYLWMPHFAMVESFRAVYGRVSEGFVRKRIL